MFPRDQCKIMHEFQSTCHKISILNFTRELKYFDTIPGMNDNQKSLLTRSKPI